MMAFAGEASRALIIGGNLPSPQSSPEVDGAFGYLLEYVLKCAEGFICAEKPYGELPSDVVWHFDAVNMC